MDCEVTALCLRVVTSVTRGIRDELSGFGWRFTAGATNRQYKACNRGPRRVTDRHELPRASMSTRSTADGGVRGHEGQKRQGKKQNMN